MKKKHQTGKAFTCKYLLANFKIQVTNRDGSPIGAAMLQHYQLISQHPWDPIRLRVYLYKGQRQISEHR